MSMKFSKNDKKNLKYIGIFAVALFLFAQFGFLTQFGITPPIRTGFDGDGDPWTEYEVYVKIDVRLVSGEKLNSSYTVELYDYENMTLLESLSNDEITTTFNCMYRVGEIVRIKLTYGSYESEITSWVVPTAGESADTVSLRAVKTGESILWIP